MDAGKDDGAMLAIGELANRIGVPTHILRYWETRFPELRPLQRSGRRRYYRAEDVALVERIHDLLHAKGYTVEGARKALGGEGGADHARREPVRFEAEAAPALPVGAGVPVLPLIALRQRLALALEG
jgi:DNA-binding transcriptional MerR regulator